MLYKNTNIANGCQACCLFLRSGSNRLLIPAGFCLTGQK